MVKIVLKEQRVYRRGNEGLDADGTDQDIRYYIDKIETLVATLS